MEILGGNVVRVGPREHRCGPRYVDLSFAVVDDGLEWVGVAVYPLGETTPRPLKAAELRECLALGDVIERAKKRLVRAGALGELVRDRKELREIAKRGAGESWRRRTPEHYAIVAEVYARAVAEGRRDPTRAVAERWPGTPRSTAANWVRRARDLGVLRPTTRGKVSAGVIHLAEARLTLARPRKGGSDAT